MGKKSHCSGIGRKMANKYKGERKILSEESSSKDGGAIFVSSDTE